MREKTADGGSGAGSGRSKKATLGEGGLQQESGSGGYRGLRRSSPVTTAIARERDDGTGATAASGPIRRRMR